MVLLILKRMAVSSLRQIVIKIWFYSIHSHRKSNRVRSLVNIVGLIAKRYSTLKTSHCVIIKPDPYTNATLKSTPDLKRNPFVFSRFAKNTPPTNSNPKPYKLHNLLTTTAALFKTLNSQWRRFRLKNLFGFLSSHYLPEAAINQRYVESRLLAINNQAGTWRIKWKNSLHLPDLR